MRECGPFSAAYNVVRIFPFAFEQHVRFANSIGLGVDLLTIKEAVDLELSLLGYAFECLFGDR